MKRLISITLTLALLATSPVNQAMAQGQKGKATATATTNAPAVNDSTDEEGIVAYSDTTETDAQGDSVTYYNGKGNTASLDWNNDQADSLLERWALELLGGTAGFWASAFATLVVILVFLFLCSPFIVLGLFIWYLVRRNRQRLEFARQAMENGQPIPQEMLSMELQTDSYMWSKGVRNVFLGLGLIVFGLFINIETLAAVGALLICMGAGQCVIAKTSGKGERRKTTPTPEDSTSEEKEAMPQERNWAYTFQQITNNARGQKGVMTAFTGLGLIVMGLFMGTDALTAVGGLVLCIGAGMCVVAKTSEKNTRKD
ncbi:MAG TPA: DUF4267 domain-containing protein [Candidatus Prevotella avicola]|uniref:DUF4267 domain-containing protein n=1 Tax=Candidatus Prevotella avicola TaxID=2838738 RepID=A0A9D2FYR5_9BACT|nr:DUF4267 domain-containing protein [Candidatus Prevotella avicola]